MNLRILVQIRLSVGKAQRAGLWGQDTVQALLESSRYIFNGYSHGWSQLWPLVSQGMGRGGVLTGGGDEEWILVG